MSPHGPEHPESPRPAGSGGSVPAVYRRRRVVALVVLLVAVLAIVWGVSAVVRAVVGTEQAQAPEPAPAAVAGSPTPTVDPSDKFAGFSPRPSHGATPSGSASSAPASEKPVAACGDALRVRASTDHETYAAEQQPVLEMTLENTGKQPCTVDASTDRMAFVVTSGAATVFDSRHCAGGHEQNRLTLEPGKKETSRLPWNRVGTAQGCPTGQPHAQPGYYALTVSLGETTSEQATFVLQ